MSLRDPDDAVRRTLVAGSRRVTDARIDLSATRTPTGFRIHASYDIALDPLSAGRCVLLEYWKSRLPIVDSASSVGVVRDLVKELGHNILYVDLPNNADSLASIHVDVSTDWNTREVHGERHPYFVVSNSVPTPILRDGDPPFRRAVFFVDRAMTSDFVITGIQHGPEAWNPVSNPQLDMILLLQHAVIRSDGADIVFAGEAARELDERHQRTIVSELRRTFDDLGRELGVTPTLRFGLFADAAPKELPVVVHSLLMGQPEVLGFDGRLVFISGQAIARQVAVWWGGGITIPGFLGFAITRAIGYALALRISESRAPKSFQSTKRVIERRASATTEPGKDHSTLKLSGELALALYQGLTEREAVRAELRAMTQEYWGLEVPASLVLQRLAAVGVTPPNGLRGLT